MAGRLHEPARVVGSALLERSGAQNLGVAGGGFLHRPLPEKSEQVTGGRTRRSPVVLKDRITELRRHLGFLDHLLATGQQIFFQLGKGAYVSRHTVHDGRAGRRDRAVLHPDPRLCTGRDG
jgi:hypothetical protein